VGFSIFHPIFAQNEYYNLFFYISKVSLRLMPYRLKGKKEVHCLNSPYALISMLRYIREHHIVVVLK
jgi:hypothetical protein